MIAPLLLAADLYLGNLGPERALWAWHGMALVRSVEARRSFLEFIRAPKGDPNRRISVIFISEVDPGDPGSAPAIGDLLADCHQAGIRVDFLCGDPRYAEPARNVGGVSLVDRVLTYNSAQPPERRFDGFQYDVEPYSLPDWPSPRLRSGFLQLFDLSEAEIRKTGSPLQLGAAIPRWFDAPDLGGLYRDVLDRVDYVAVMDYVDTPRRFVHDASNTVAYASRVGKKAWLGAEATELPKEPMATFYAEGNAAMEAAFTAAQDAFGSSSGFAGVAIEYYDSYLTLRP